MIRDAAFWRWYAEASDSIRHEVVERPWFQGRSVTQDINENDMPGMAPTESEPASDVPVIDAHYEEVHAEELYGPDLIEAPEAQRQLPEPEQEMD